MDIEQLHREYQMALLNAEQADSHEDRAIKAVLPYIMAGVRQKGVARLALNKMAG